MSHARTRRITVGLVLASVLAATLPASRALDASTLLSVDERVEAAEPALKGISSRIDGNLTTLRIEATDPVAYVTSRPDALTVLVDLRNVRVPTSADRVPASMAPIGGVAIERTTETDGTPVARVRISLTQALQYRVRSARNLIFVEVDRTTLAEAAALATRNGQAAPALKITPGARPALVRASAAQDPASPAPTPQAVPLEPRPLTTAQACGEPPFTGDPVSLDFQGGDLRAVLRLFAEISGLNVVLDPAIPSCGPSGAGCVDLALRDVPWDQALAIVLKANKLGCLIDGTIVRIASLDALKAEEQARRTLAEEQALAGELRVLTRTLSYAKAPEMVPILERSALSQRGEIQVDQRTNTLVIRDLPDRLGTADGLITALDRPERQVEIEARIIRVRRDYSRELGILWGVNGRVAPDLGNTTGLAFPNSGSLSGRTGTTQGPDGADTAVNLPTQNTPTGAIGLSLGSVNGAFRLDVALQALEDQGKLRLLSSPRVSTQNNVEAEITQGTQIPLQTVANNTVSVTFKDAALTLRVTPQITASDTVILRISLEKAQADFSRSINGIPPIDTQRAVTNVLLANGETTVIGGIFESQEISGQAAVPLLSRIPLLGWLFKNSQQSEFQDELMIFITPRIQKG